MRLECEIIPYIYEDGTNIVGLCNTLDIAVTKNSVKEVSFYLKKAKVAWIPLRPALTNVRLFFLCNRWG